MTLQASAEGRSAHAGLRSYWPEWLAATVWLGTTIATFGIAVPHDVVWQFWIARQLNAGMGLYSWLQEVNPPLWYWMAQPLDWLAARLALPPVTLLSLAIALLAAISLACMARLAASWPARHRAALYLVSLAAMVIVPLADFGQREHLVVIASIPYALLIAARAERRPVSLHMALAVALLATPVFALKHYFVLMPIALEAWLLWRLRRYWRPVRVETLVLAIGALGYGAAVLVFAPDYLTTMVPALRLAYGDLRMSTLAIFVSSMNMLLLVAGLYLFHFRRELSPQVQAMLIVAAAGVIAYYLQFKGWNNHALPVLGALLVAVVLHLAQRPSLPPLRWSERLAAALVVIIGLLPSLLQGPFRADFAPYADRMLAQAKPGDSVAMLAVQGAPIWPMLDQWGLIWPSRYYHLWMLPTIADQLATGQPLRGPLLELADRMRRETVDDFACNPPRVIIEDGTGVGREGLRIMDFFMDEPGFAALMQSYRVQSTLGPFTVYERIADLPAPTGPCMTLAPAHQIDPRPGAPA
ncbi:MAG: hypothetical protein P0Y65_00945 [Candidatus Devosia phytovorans]|uniref:Uncharacterized protein n=1 Tax=Candidatus Devosia phytovorans TaxID=3121372 RepID=A0AAJ6B056_9HYPH|nr:hypothetical protein [Devosia sp.]WEK04852.1 MAG: hypothetical protein P0Y65_00945 [Devosia sp.]